MKNGHEVLSFIKNQADLKKIPVIMLTTSSSATDILKSYNNDVNCYITKPIAAEDFINCVRKINHFWFQIVKLPPTK